MDRKVGPPTNFKCHEDRASRWSALAQLLCPGQYRARKIKNKIMVPKLLVAVATYNEIENLPRLVEAIHQAAPHADLLVIDDHSPDGTGRWCLARKETDPQFDCLIRGGKQGLGTAVQAAMHYAMSHEYDFFVNLDADFSHDPAKIPELLTAMGTETDVTYDVAIGSRYVPGGGVKGWPLRRKIMSRCVNTFARFCLGLQTKDNSGAFRCYRVSTLERILAEPIREGTIRSKGYSFFEEILFLLNRDGASMIEIPIIFVDRKYGKSKINPKEAMKAIGIIFLLGMSRFFGKR